MQTVIAKHRNINRDVLSPLQRFKGFSDNWNEYKFSDVFSFKPTNSLSRDALTNEAGEIKNIHYGDIHTKYRNRFHINKEEVPYIKVDINLSGVSDESYCKVGDIVIADASEDYQDIGKTIEIIEIDNQKILGGLHTFIARPKSNTFALGFLAYLMRAETMRLQIMTLAQGTKVLGISTKHLNEIFFKAPSLPEQQKIASFLTSVDEWIENMRLEKNSLERYKRGMMQKLFSKEVRFKDENNKDFPDWKEKHLNDVGEVVGGGTPDTTNSGNWNGEINWFTPTEIKEKYVNESNRKISEAGLESSSARLLPVGTLLLTSRATIGDISISRIECATNQGFQSIIVNDKNYNEFLYYWIKFYKNEFLRRANGSTFLEISGKEVRKIKISLPSYDEQHTIGEFLASLDKVIELKQAKISQVELWKKGLLRKMLI